MSDDVVRRLAEALAERRKHWDADELRAIAADLAPVVDELARQRAAEELEAAADDMPGRPGTSPSQDFLLARADALREEADR